MKKINFITELVLFWIKGEISFDNNFVKFKIPNTIFFGLIPLGSRNKSVPINQLASVGSDFSLKLKQLILGIILAWAGISMITEETTIVAVIFLILGILNILNSFKTKLLVSLTSGEKIELNIVIFEKSKAEDAEETLNKLISRRLDDTNNRMQTDRIVDAIKNK